MIILPKSVIDKREKILRQWERGSIDSASAFERLLELVPDDEFALLHLGATKAEAGDVAGAVELLWRSIEANPCQWQAYLELGQWIEKQPGSEALARGVAELGFRNLLLDPAAIEKLEDLPFPAFAGEDDEGDDDEFDNEDDDEGDEFDDEDENDELDDEDEDNEFQGFNKTEAIGFYADQLLHKRDLEPPDVTVRLRPYRLLHMMRKAEDLDREGVNTLLAAGVSMVPVLVGAIRAVARGIVEDEGTALPENSLALLGELAPVSIVPDLLAACAIDDVNIAGCAGWALDRIAQRDPDGVREAMIQAAPNLSAEDRLGLTIRLARAPELDSDCAVIENLARNLDTLDRETVTMMMPVLVSLPFVVKGRAGGALARSILRRNGSLVSGKVRAECEAIIEGLTESGAPPPLPAAEPPDWSVYDICGGQATWDAGEDEFEESGDDDFPEPVHRAPALGRNDPCWCGSGKKYKKCHLDADREQERERESFLEEPAGEFNALRRRLGAFLDVATTEAERMDASREFKGGDLTGEEADAAALTDWLVHDWTPPSLPHGIMQEFLRRHGRSLTAPERDMVESWSRSFVGLYEIRELRPGVGLQLKDLISGKELFVHDIRLSREAVRWDGLLVRVVEGERGLELAGIGLAVPRKHLDAFRDWLVEDRRQRRLPWREYFKQNLPRIRRRPDQLGREWIESLQLTNHDGELIVQTKASYEVLDPAALIGALNRQEAFSTEEEGKHYVWLKGSPAEEGRTVLAHFRLDGAVLEVQTNSRERKERARKLLEKIAGGAVRHLRDEVTSLEEMKREILANPPDPAKPIPPETLIFLQREMEKHYFSWPDQPLPALGGKTAREAVKTAGGRSQVIELLREFENGEEHNRRAGRPYFDVGRLRAELGLEKKGASAKVQ